MKYIYSLAAFCSLFFRSKMLLSAALASGDQADFPTITVAQNSIEDQINEYDQIYAAYPIHDRIQFEKREIPDLKHKARLGLGYVRGYYTEKTYPTIAEIDTISQQMVLRGCTLLEQELDFITTRTERSRDLTPLEFMCFNYKLAALQSFDCLKNVKNVLRKPMEDYLNLMYLPFYRIEFWYPEIPPELNNRGRLMIFYQPYVIYTPTGGIPERFFVQKVCVDHNCSNGLMGLPIGRIPLDQSLYNNFFRSPIGFFNHEEWHTIRALNLKSQLPMVHRQFMNLVRTDDPLMNILLFYIFHENINMLMAVINDPCIADEVPDVTVSLEQDTCQPLKAYMEKAIITYLKHHHDLAYEGEEISIEPHYNYELHMKQLMGALIQSHCVEEADQADFVREIEKKFKERVIEKMKAHQFSSGQDLMPSEEIVLDCHANDYHAAKMWFLLYEAAIHVRRKR